VPALRILGRRGTARRLSHISTESQNETPLKLTGFWARISRPYLVKAVVGLEDYPVDVTTGPLQWKDAEHRLYEDAAQLIADNDQDAALRYRLSQDYS